MPVSQNGFPQYNFHSIKNLCTWSKKNQKKKSKKKIKKKKSKKKSKNG